MFSSHKRKHTVLTGKLMWTQSFPFSPLVHCVHCNSLVAAAFKQLCCSSPRVQGGFNQLLAMEGMCHVVLAYKHMPIHYCICQLAFKQFSKNDSSRCPWIITVYSQERKPTETLNVILCTDLKMLLLLVMPAIKERKSTWYLMSFCLVQNYRNTDTGHGDVCKTRHQPASPWHPTWGFWLWWKVMRVWQLWPSIQLLL